MLYGSALGNNETERDAYLATRFTMSRVGDATALDANVLATTDLVLVEYLNSAHTTAEANALATWISNGGTLLVTCGWVPGNTDLPRYNALLATIGLVFKEPKVQGPLTQFFTHPISANITSLPFVDGYELTLPATGAVEVGRLSGAPVLAAITRGTGRIVAIGDDFFNFTGEWQGDVPTFWAHVIDWLAP
jgi:hypothetical protein